MTDHNVSVPPGAQDFLFADCERRRALESKLFALFGRHGYREAATPVLEYYDLFTLPQEEMVKAVDREGRVLVLRPDSTVPLARVAATKLSGDVHRLFYCQPVFHSDRTHGGHQSQMTQVGCELMGPTGLEADLEMLTLAAESLEACGLSEYTLEIGHAALFSSLAARLGADAEVVENMRRQVELKNFPAVMDMLEPFEQNPAYLPLSRLSGLFGGAEIFAQAGDLGDQIAMDALAYLQKLASLLEERGFGGRVRVDLGLAGRLDYYTGVIFSGFIPGYGSAVLQGGRYDNLCRRFGKDMGATGFCLDLDALLAAASAKREGQTGQKPLRLALTKGRLEKKTIEMLQKAGVDCTALLSPGRELVRTLTNPRVDVVLAKASDVITYVEHGVCDMGIVGKDTIMEQGRAFYEVRDLGFGKCRFALAVREGDDFFGFKHRRRVATKYPGVTKDFFAKKGMDVEIIRIEGSVELAPLLGLADAIVDIVETGETLRANGLIPVEDVHPISARLIVNVASMKMRKAEVAAFSSLCKGGGI